jgi:hypothetical protein
MVNFVEPAEYMFGTSEMSHKAQQGGIYNRAVVGVRVENLPKDTIEDLDHYYRRLSRRDRQKEAKFSLLFSPIYVRMLPRRPILFPLTCLDYHCRTFSVKFCQLVSQNGEIAHDGHRWDL